MAVQLRYIILPVPPLPPKPAPPVANNAAQLRIRVADMKLINPFTIMPGFYKSAETINRIAAQYEGSTILSAQEVEDIVSYLITLKTQANSNIYESYP